MDPNELSILVRALDGEWETLGSESTRFRGVVPENVQFSADQWGSSTCSFELRRDPGVLHPDLAAFTECEIWVAGLKCWSGRVKETPTREGADPIISVQGQGWQYHLDDDLYQRMYTRMRLDGFTDMRSSLTATLGEAGLAAAGQVSIDGTAITLTYPSGALFYSGTTVGCYLDLGPEPASWMQTISLEATTSNNTSGVSVFARASSSGPDNSTWSGGSYEDAINASLTTIGAGPYAWLHNCATPRRWLQLFIFLPVGAGAATGADHWVRFHRVMLHSDPSWGFGGYSSLRASAVVNDALSRTTVKLSSDRSLVEPVDDQFPIPEFEMSSHQTPREVISAVNAFENYETKVDVERVPVFRPRVTAPLYEIGEWSGAEFEDASANSGEEILNRVIVQGTGAGGVPISVERWAGGLSPGSFSGISPLANPSGTVDATGWSVSGTLTRNTTTFFSSPASLHGQTPGPAAEPFVMTASASGTITSGQRYRLYLQYRPAQIILVYSITLKVTVTPSNRVYEKTFDVAGSTLFAPLILDFLVPESVAANTGYTVQITGNRQGSGTRNIGFFEDISLSRITTTVVDRQGFVRSRVMPVQNRVTEASAARLGDLYLEQHRTTPFTGGFKATGLGGVRRMLGGTSVHPAWLAKDTGQLVRVGHVIDPDTGAIGRDERIAAVTYSHNEQTATVSLSEDRAGFDSLLSRLAAVVR
jgi:hypothetical protein